MDRFQRLMPLFLITAWILFGLLYSAGVIGVTQWVILGVCHILCLLVFVNFVYVFSYSYALCSIASSAALLLAYQPNLWVVAPLVVQLAYGLRLLIFVGWRNRVPSYTAKREFIEQANRDMPTPVKGILWVFCSWMMFFHAYTHYVVVRAEALPPLAWCGVGLMLAGLLLESIADWQKQKLKQQDSLVLVTRGLYRRCRHPNYSGEIVFQLGLIFIAFSLANSWIELAASCLMTGYIVILMIVTSRKQDASQQSVYGETEVYRSWHRSSGSLFPRLSN